MKSKILLVGDYNRNDFIYVAKLLADKVDFYFIEFLNKKEFKNKECLNFGEVIFWKDYKSAYTLLDKIKPEKVIFYFIESFNHVALNVACKVRGIITYHLEHGMRFSLSYYIEGDKTKQVPSRIKKTLKTVRQVEDFYDKYKNRQFFELTKLQSPITEKIFLDHFFMTRSRNTIFKTFQLLQNPLRIPDHYISFSPKIFNYHRELENLPDNYPVSFIGIPQFDEFYKWNQFDKTEGDILFIDQPLHERKIYGWTRENKSLFLIELAKIVKSFGKKIYVKPHPLNDLDLYSYLLPDINITVITDQWDNVMTDINIVLGFSSTFLLPFMAMDHISCFTLEMHPERLEIPFSQFLLDSGACHAINTFEELALKFRELKYWHCKQIDAKAQFIQNYMFKFDGKSSDRLKNILLGEAP